MGFVVVGDGLFTFSTALLGGEEDIKPTRIIGIDGGCCYRKSTCWKVDPVHP